MRRTAPPFGAPSACPCDRPPGIYTRKEVVVPVPYIGANGRATQPFAGEIRALQRGSGAGESAGERTRTSTPLRGPGPKPGASANSATPAAVPVVPVTWELTALCLRVP